MITDKDRLEFYEQTKLRVLFRLPFFVPGLLKLGRAKFSDEVETACTDGKEIVFGRAYWDKLDPKVRGTTACHEVMHCLWNHFERAPQGCDWAVWNQACDHEVNNIMATFSAADIAQGKPDPLPFPDPKEAYCCDPRFAGMSAEHIYSILIAEKRGQGKQKPSNKPGQSGGKPGQQQGQQGQQGQKPAPHSMPSFGDIKQPGKDAKSEEAVKELGHEWKKTLIDSVAAHRAKGKGNLPANIARLVDQLVNPRVPWYEILRHWLREQASDDWNWAKPNQYYSDCDFILPSLDSERIGEMVTAKDSSGSIDHEAAAQFNTEIQSALDDLRPSRLVDIVCDARIHAINEYTPGDTIDPKIPGGGGTDFRPVFDWVKESDRNVKCLVYLTDLDGTFPSQEPSYPVIWVVWGKAFKKPPFGEVVRIDDN